MKTLPGPWVSVPGEDPPDLNALARLARRGDRDALEQLLRGLHPFLYAVASARTGSALAAEDLAAEACVGIVRGIGSYRGDGPIEAWALAVLRNRIRQWHRTRRRRPETLTAELPDVVSTQEVEAGVADRLEVVRVTQALARLPERTIAVIFARVYEGLSAGDTATRLGMSEGAVRVALHRALVRLREELE